jgi:hypothetical protein
MGFEIVGEAVAEEVLVGEVAAESATAWTAADAAAMGAMTEGGAVAGSGALAAAGAMALRAGVQAGISMLTAKLLGGRLNRTETAQGTLVNSLSTVDPIPVVYGIRRVGATVCPVGVSGSAQEFLHLLCIWSEGPISAIGIVYLDGVAATDGKFAGLVTREDFLGTDGQAASATLIAAFADASRWNASCTLAGIAYTYLILKWDQTAFARGRPLITADVNGRTLFDPRASSTGFSRNPWLAMRDYLTNSRYGRGYSSAVIDDATFQGEANHADASVAIPGGGTQARYTCDGVVNPDDAPLDIVKGLLSSCRGNLIYSGGKYKAQSDRIQPITISGGYESSSWVAGSTMPPGYSANQDIAGESTFASRTGPYGASEVVNLCVQGNVSVSGPAGGWDMNTYIPADRTKGYLFAVWAKRKVANGQFYWGMYSTGGATQAVLVPGGSNVGADPNNPYFVYGAESAILAALDQWYLVIGYLHPLGYGGNYAGFSGVYNTAGVKVVDGGDYAWPAAATGILHRCYHYYNTIDGNGTELQQMVRPVVIQCTTALAPAVISALLAGPTSGGFALSERQHPRRLELAAAGAAHALQRGEGALLRSEHELPAEHHGVAARGRRRSRWPTSRRTTRLCSRRSSSCRSRRTCTRRSRSARSRRRSRAIRCSSRSTRRSRRWRSRWATSCRSRMRRRGGRRRAIRPRASSFASRRWSSSRATRCAWACASTTLPRTRSMR